MKSIQLKEKIFERFFQLPAAKKIEVEVIQEELIARQKLFAEREALLKTAEQDSRDYRAAIAPIEEKRNNLYKAAEELNAELYLRQHQFREREHQREDRRREIETELAATASETINRFIQQLDNLRENMKDLRRVHEIFKGLNHYGQPVIISVDNIDRIREYLDTLIEARKKAEELRLIANQEEVSERIAAMQAAIPTVEDITSPPKTIH
jgi:hypothetical protein